MKTLVVRKTLFDLIGKFNADYGFAGDVDWYARFTDKNIAILNELRTRRVLM